MTQGIIVGSDMTQEWLLPWWWKNYSRHNSYPVAFFDFGLSAEKKTWCREHGQLVSLRMVDFAVEKEMISPGLVNAWETQFGKSFWSSRGAWFKKPLACKGTPFEKTMWIDLDCEIRGSIEPLFQYTEHPSGIAMVRDSFEKPVSYQIYNSGVVVFRKDLPLIDAWAEQSFEKNDAFRGDQELLSHLIAEKQISIGEISPLYNWSRCQEDHSGVVVHHWHGEFGRSIIKHELWKQSASCALGQFPV